jgi:hypothetical protein
MSNNIYILYKLENRAETTDTILYYASKDKGLLEEIMLSIWEEAKYLIWNYPNNPIDKQWREDSLNSYIEQFNITSIPEVE